MRILQFLWFLNTGGTVCDLGSGCGILSIGAALVGAEFVCGIEMDPDAIDIAVENCHEFFEDDDEPSAINFVNAELQIDEEVDADCCHRFNSTFDVVSSEKKQDSKIHSWFEYSMHKIGLLLNFIVLFTFFLRL